MTRGVVGSEYNTDAEVMAGYRFADDVYLVDSTIRSLQSGVSGSAHSVDDLVEIGVAIDQIGVRELIVNVSWRDGFEVIKELGNRGVSAKVVATFRARDSLWREWTEAAAAAGADEVCLESALDEPALSEGAAFVEQTGMMVSHAFAESYTYDEVVRLVQHGITVGCQSQSFHDSFFRMAVTPDGLRLFVNRIIDHVPNHPPLYVHLSNFFGQATATAVAAVTAGASAIDVCANGTGHHCGHTSLGEVATAIELLYGVRTGIRLEQLSALSQLVAARTRVPVPFNSPVVGEFAFVQDGAYWAAEAHVSPDNRVHATFPYPPSVVGARERIVWNDRTLTPDALGTKISTLTGSAPQVTLVQSMLDELRARLELIGHPRWLSDPELGEFLSSRLTDDTPPA